MAEGGRSTEDSARKASTRSRTARLWIVASALAFYAVFVFRTSFRLGETRYFVLFEDAMISMRYARHLAAGHGLVWNIGEPPIEGFTNLLWVLWMSVAHLLGLSESKVSLFVMLTGVAIMVTTGLVTAKIARKTSGAPWVPLVALAATLFCYPLVFWTLRGMEVGALTLTVVTLLWLALENEDRFSFPRTVAMGAITAAALLLRSDSVVPIGLISLYGFLTCSKRWLFAATIGVFAGGAVGGQTVFRKEYFHETLPNTYFLKLYKISALDRIKRGAFVALEVLAFHLAAPLSVVFAGADVPTLRLLREDKKARRLVLLASLFAAQIAYATYVGGDAWEWMLYANRYTCAAMPALVVLVAVLLEIVLAKPHARVPGRLSNAFLLAGAVLVVLNVYAKLRPETGIAATMTFSKTPFAGGAAFLGLGVLLRLRDVKGAVMWALDLARTYLASRRTVAVTALVLVAVVWLPAHLLPLGRWAAQNAAQYKDEAHYTRLGLLIRASTPPAFRIAVAAAGATPYFAERPTEDLLGKNDRHVAKLAPRGVFSPGHDKWDYAYSLEERKSDLIVETVDVNPADEKLITDLGFETLTNGMRLRRGASAQRAVLDREVDDGDIAASLGPLPEGLRGIDIAMILAFAVVILLAARGVVKDDESFQELDAEPPLVPDDVDEAAEAARKGADARAIPTLDGMRGLAVLAVLAFHFAWTMPGDDATKAVTIVEKLAVRVHAFFWSGWTGVDLFFVLSGYLITRGLVTPSAKALGKRMKSFWMRRVLRIFPLYYAVLAVGTLVTLALGARWVPGVAYWFYMQNYVLAFDDEIMRWTAHFWSLAIEEQFYFVWPIVALTVSRRRLIPTIIVLTAGTVLLRAFLVFKGAQVHALEPLFSHHEGTAYGIAKFVYRATFTRADGLLLGAFVAVTQRELQHPVAKAWRRLRYPIFLATFGVLALLYVWANGLNDYDRRIMGIGYFVLALFFASGVSLCADARLGERARAFMSSRLLVSCGKVSYGMYIFHWPLVIVAVPRLLRAQAGMSIGMQLLASTSFIVVGIAFIWVCASLSFRFFESWFLRLKGKFHD